MTAKDRTPKALERSIKKEIHAQAHEVHIRFPKFLGDVGAAEVESVLNASLLPTKFEPQIAIEETAIVVTGIGSRQLFELPLRLRTAHEILWVLRKSRAGSLGDLKDEVGKIPWSLYFAPKTKVAVKLEATASKIFHETAAIKVVQGVLKNFDIVPTTRDNADQLIEIKIKKNHLQIALSLANGHLYRRGYKHSLKAIASSREDLAACATQLTQHWLEDNWGEDLTPPDLIYAGFAGSGTLGFEALMSWYDLAPAVWQEPYACEKLVCAPQDSLVSLRKKLQPTKNPPTHITFVEKNAAQTDALEVDITHFVDCFSKNKKAPLCDVITADLFKQTALKAKHVFIPLNPPYGVRLKDGGPAIYQKLGLWLTKINQAKHGAISGYVFIPDEATRKAFLKALQGYKLSGQSVVSGGKTLTLAVFRSL